MTVRCRPDNALAREFVITGHRHQPDGVARVGVGRTRPRLRAPFQIAVRAAGEQTQDQGQFRALNGLLGGPTHRARRERATHPLTEDDEPDTAHRQESDDIGRTARDGGVVVHLPQPLARAALRVEGRAQTTGRGPQPSWPGLGDDARSAVTSAIAADTAGRRGAQPHRQDRSHLRLYPAFGASRVFCSGRRRRSVQSAQSNRTAIRKPRGYRASMAIPVTR